VGQSAGTPVDCDAHAGIPRRRELQRLPSRGRMYEKEPGAIEQFRPGEREAQFEAEWVKQGAEIRQPGCRCPINPAGSLPRTILPARGAFTYFYKMVMCAPVLDRAERPITEYRIAHAGHNLCVGALRTSLATMRAGC